jgi:hypothetical protein
MLYLGRGRRLCPPILNFKYKNERLRKSLILFQEAGVQPH